MTITDLYALEFARLTHLWRSDCLPTADIWEVWEHPAYQKIVDLGPNVIPLIRQRIHGEGDDPDHWDYALELLC